MDECLRVFSSASLPLREGATTRRDAFGGLGMNELWRDVACNSERTGLLDYVEKELQRMA